LSALRPAVAILALTLAGSAAAWAAEGDAMPFLSHRAVYELTLAKTVGEKAPVSVTGRIVYEFTGSACEGYVTNFRQVTELQPTEGGSRVTDMRSSTFEDGAAKSFRFKIQTTVDDAVQEDLDGTATRAADDSVAVALAHPEAGKVDLPPGVVFPTQHLQRIIAAAKAGEHTLTVKAYDGSDTGRKVFDTFTVIGKAASEPSPETVDHAEAFKDVRRWPVAMSYFEAGKTDGPPNYTLSFDLYENGVSGDLKLDYGDFVLTGKMSKFDVLPETACKK
jgi:hypothetical protein